MLSSKYDLIKKMYRCKIDLPDARLCDLDVDHSLIIFTELLLPINKETLALCESIALYKHKLRNMCFIMKLLFDAFENGFDTLNSFDDKQYTIDYITNYSNGIKLSSSCSIDITLLDDDNFYRILIIIYKNLMFPYRYDPLIADIAGKFYDAIYQFKTDDCSNVCVTKLDLFTNVKQEFIEIIRQVCGYYFDCSLRCKDFISYLHYWYRTTSNPDTNKVFNVINDLNIIAYLFKLRPVSPDIISDTLMTHNSVTIAINRQCKIIDNRLGSYSLETWSKRQQEWQIIRPLYAEVFSRQTNCPVGRLTLDALSIIQIFLTSSNL